VYPPARGKPSREDVEAFRVAGTRLLERLGKEAGQGPGGANKRDTYRRFRDALEDVGDEKVVGWADTLVGLVNAEFADKLGVYHLTFSSPPLFLTFKFLLSVCTDLLAAADPTTRLHRATSIFTKQSSISEVSSKISEAVQDSLSKQQKEFFLRQQLAAIQRELNNLRSSSSSPNTPANGQSNGVVRSELDDDETSEAEDMADIRKKIEAMEVGSEQRKTGVREWRRLKRIPQGSVEHGVIRNYVGLSFVLPFTPLPNDALTRIPAFSSNGLQTSPGLHQPQQTPPSKKASKS